MIFPQAPIVVFAASQDNDMRMAPIETLETGMEEGGKKKVAAGLLGSRINALTLCLQQRFYELF